MVAIRRNQLPKICAIFLLLGMLTGITMPAYAWADMELDWYWNEFDYMTKEKLLYNALPHEYLAGYYSEDGSEITITGMKLLSDDDFNGTKYVYRDSIVIPDEIEGVPVTALAESAFEFYGDMYVGGLGNNKLPIILGKNIRTIEYSALSNMNVYVGRENAEGLDGIYGAYSIHCYENSLMYQTMQTGWFRMYSRIDNPDRYDGYFYAVLPESRLISDKVEIDENGFVHLPEGVTKQTLGDYVSVDGDATLRMVGDDIRNGTQIELVNNTYGTIDNTYTILLGGKQIAITAKSQLLAYTGTVRSFVTGVKTTGSACTLTYTSDNPDVATVDEDGKIHAKKAGTATIIVNAKDGTSAMESVRCAVTVTDRAYLTSTEKIDSDNRIIYLPFGVTKEMLGDYLTLHGDATMVLSDENVTTGTQIKLVNNTYGTTDMVYTVKREEPKITLTVEEEHIAYVGSTFRLNAQVQTNGTPCKLSYRTDTYPPCAVVDEDGNFTAVRPGTVTYRVNAKDQLTFQQEAYCRITVIPRAVLTSDTLEIDEQFRIHVTEGVTKQDLESRLSVDGNATVRIPDGAIRNGTKIELVNKTYGTVDQVYTVVFPEPEISLTVEDAHISYAKSTFTLNPSVETNGTPCTLSYSSDVPDVATVDGTGTVTTGVVGTATITVTATDEDGFTKTTTCSVMVIDRATLISDKVEIDDSFRVHLVKGITVKTLGEYVSVDGNAEIRISDGIIKNGTKIELVNNTYDMVDNTYTVVLLEPEITLSVETVAVVYAKTAFTLVPSVETNGTPCTLTYSTNNSKVATVDENGIVTTHKSGTATITITATDEAGCTQTTAVTVTVKYSWWQWLILVLLFGWLWY